ELDVSRTEPCQRGGEPALAAFSAWPLDQPRQRHRGLGRQRERPRIDQREHALARKHETGARQADEMRYAGNHKRQPECSATTPPVIGVTDTRRKPACSIICAKALGLGNLRIDST